MYCDHCVYIVHCICSIFVRFRRLLPTLSNSTNSFCLNFTSDCSIFETQAIKSNKLTTCTHFLSKHVIKINGTQGYGVILQKSIRNPTLQQYLEVFQTNSKIFSSFYKEYNMSVGNYAVNATLDLQWSVQQSSCFTFYRYTLQWEGYLIFFGIKRVM